MKLYTKAGSFKALQHLEDPDAVILMATEDWVLPRLKEINAAVETIETAEGRAYPYHAKASKAVLAQILFSLAMDLDYPEHNRMCFDLWPQPEVGEESEDDLKDNDELAEKLDEQDDVFPDEAEELDPD